jgi:hypothetical protein
MAIYSQNYIPYFYIIQDIRNGMYYAGAKWAQDANPSNFMIEGGYETSSETIKELIQQYGLNNFVIRKIRTFSSAQKAYDYETRFLQKIDARNNPSFYNKHNNDGWIPNNKGKVVAKDGDGNFIQVDIDDPRYLSGELVGTTKGKKPGICIYTGKKTSYEIIDPRWETGEIISVNKSKSMYIDKDGKYVYTDRKTAEASNLKPFQKGMVTARDSENNIIRVSQDDPRYLSGELVGATKGFRPVKDQNGNVFMLSSEIKTSDKEKIKELNSEMCVVKDSQGNIFRVHKDDPRYLSGELVGITKNMVLVRDPLNPNDPCFYVDKNDSRYTSGQLVHHSKGKIRVSDKDGNNFYTDKNDPRIADGTLTKNYKSGYKWYTDGKSNIMIDDGDDIPSGFYLGTTTKYKKRCYTDGKINRFIIEGETPPKGFYLGRTVSKIKKQWFTNGEKNIKIIEGDTPPAGFRRGTTHKKRNK